MQAIAPLTITTLARLTGVDVPSIRSYEEMGLVPKPRRGRGRGGYQGYHQEHLDRVMFIRRALEAGFSLKAMSDLIGMADGRGTCDDVYQIAERELVSIRRRIADLQRQEMVLSELVEGCPRTGPGSECTILAVLRRPAPSRRGS